MNTIIPQWKKILLAAFFVLALLSPCGACRIYNYVYHNTLCTDSNLNPPEAPTFPDSILVQADLTNSVDFTTNFYKYKTDATVSEVVEFYKKTGHCGNTKDYAVTGQEYIICSGNTLPEARARLLSRGGSYVMRIRQNSDETSNSQEGTVYELTIHWRSCYDPFFDD